MKHLRRLLQLVKLALRDFAGCNQLAHLLLRVALKRRAELLKLLHHLLKISQRSGHLPAAKCIKQWFILRYPLLLAPFQRFKAFRQCVKFFPALHTPARPARCWMALRMRFAPCSQTCAWTAFLPRLPT